MPITLEDEQYFGPMMKEICETRLSKDEDGWYVRPPTSVSQSIKTICSGITRIQSSCHTPQNT